MDSSKESRKIRVSNTTNRRKEEIFKNDIFFSFGIE
jgi:hypothetical protein